MRNLLTLGLALVAITALAKPINNKQLVKASKKKGCAQKEPCKLTYDEIREQLRDEEITLEEAQKLWIEHREQEKI